MTHFFKAGFQIATLLFSLSVSTVVGAAPVEKNQHEGLLLDSKITYVDSGHRDVEAKVILNGDAWTLVDRTPQGHLLYGRTEKVTAVTPTAGADLNSTAGSVTATNSPPTGSFDNETVRVLYREMSETGAEIGTSATTASIGSPANVDLKDAHIQTRVSKIRYQLE